MGFKEEGTGLILQYERKIETNLEKEGKKIENTKAEKHKIEIKKKTDSIEA